MNHDSRHLPAVEVSAVRRMIEIMAAERTREHPELFDDAVQEGLIADWEVRKRVPGKPDSYYRSASRRAIGDVVRGRPAFGAERHRGSQDAHGFSGPISVTNDDGREVWAIEPSYEHQWVDIDGIVRGAVARLEEEDREMVFRRFWLDQTYPEAAKAMGRTRQALERRWANHVRPSLQGALA